MKRHIQIVGLGQIGRAVIDALRAVDPDNRVVGDEITGVDVSPVAHLSANLDGIRTFERPTKADIYFICVWSTEQVLEVLPKLPWRARPLVFIETTLRPSDLTHVFHASKGARDVVLFPHRWNPGDREHGVFNQPRVIGGWDRMSLHRAELFLRDYMDLELIVRASCPQMVALCKLAENAYRYAEIVLAQELATHCAVHAHDFEELRRLMNTKWNIDVREARDGVGGKCLPFALEQMAGISGLGIWDYLWMKNDQYARISKQSKGAGKANDGPATIPASRDPGGDTAPAVKRCF